MIDSLVGMAATGGLSAGLGAGLSVLGKIINASQDRKRLDSARNAEEMQIICDSMNQANKRGGAGGIWIRRFIVLSLFGFLFGVLAANGILSHWFEQIPATYAYMEEVPSRWFGLIRAKQTLQTVPLSGIPVFEQAVNMMWLIGTFYFGSSRIK